MYCPLSVEVLYFRYQFRSFLLWIPVHMKTLLFFLLPHLYGVEFSAHCAFKMIFFFSRLDTFVGLFAVCCQPTSTSDPFRLKRISYGVVSI